MNCDYARIRKDVPGLFYNAIEHSHISAVLKRWNSKHNSDIIVFSRHSRIRIVK